METSTTTGNLSGKTVFPFCASSIEETMPDTCGLEQSQGASVGNGLTANTLRGANANGHSAPFLETEIAGVPFLVREDVDIRTPMRRGKGIFGFGQGESLKLLATAKEQNTRIRAKNGNCEEPEKNFFPSFPFYDIIREVC